GQALERALLVATTHHVLASFATTVLENPTTRHDLRQALDLPGHPQMVMRLGTAPRGDRTPRRTRPRHDAMERWVPWRGPTATRRRRAGRVPRPGARPGRGTASRTRSPHRDRRER